MNNSPTFRGSMGNAVLREGQVRKLRKYFVKTEESQFTMEKGSPLLCSYTLNLVSLWAKFLSY